MTGLATPSEANLPAATVPIGDWDRRAAIGMAVVDVDHTLITDDHRLTARVVHAVQAARRRGVHVILASSRPPLGLVPFLHRLGLTGPEPFIAAQGGLIAVLDGVPGAGHVQVRHSMPMPARIAREVAAAGEAAGMSVNWYAGTEWFVTRGDDPRVRREAAVVGVRPVEARLVELTKDPEKLLLIAPGPRVGRGPHAAAGIPSLTLPAAVQGTYSNTGYLEVTAAGVDKGNAVRIVANAAGIPMQNVAAFGDGENDIAMFRAAGVAVAPANAAPHVRAEADYVTASNNDDGVARALEVLLGLQRP